jgi:hypothetical protein
MNIIPFPTSPPESPVDTVDTVSTILSHLLNLHHTQKILAEQSVGAANQIFILEHILNDIGVPIPSTTGAPLEAKKEAPEGPPLANPNPSPAPEGGGTNPGNLIL